jgi:hypothetical protein
LTPITRAPASTARCYLVLVVHLDQRRHAERLGPLAQRHQRLLLEGRHDEQDDVGAVGARLPQLIARHHEVLAQHRNVDAGPDGVEVVEAAAEAPPLGSTLTTLAPPAA